MAEDLGEKTEDPTAKRRLDARRKGQAPRSQDLTAAVLLTAGVILIALFAGDLFGGAAALLRRALEPDTLGRELTPDSILTFVLFQGGQTLRLTAPIMLIMAFVALVDQIFQVGWMVSAEPIQPKLSNLSVLSGVKRLFSKRNVMKGLINIVKLMVITVVVAIVVQGDFQKIAALPNLTVAGGIVVGAHIVLRLSIWSLIALAVIGVADRLFQSWQHTQELKMSRHEVKEERKSSEGDAEMKGRRLKMAREIIRQRLRTDVPQADVVVTNPTHYSVALKYEEGKMTAPRVIAKGADMMAMQIRLIAASSGVPIVERPPLARALYFGVEVGQDIPTQQYEAVAEVLAYVYRLEGRMAS